LLRRETRRHVRARAAQAIASTSEVRVLSTPEIGREQPRELHPRGRKVPFVSSTATGNDVAIDRAVQYQDVGTKLSIIPTINDATSCRCSCCRMSTLTTQTIEAAWRAGHLDRRGHHARHPTRRTDGRLRSDRRGAPRRHVGNSVPDGHPVARCAVQEARTTTNRSELAIFVTPYLVRTDETPTGFASAFARAWKSAQGVLDGTPSSGLRHRMITGANVMAGRPPARLRRRAGTTTRAPRQHRRARAAPALLREGSRMLPCRLAMM
jgi:general secretion pathway protein D